MSSARNGNWLSTSFQIDFIERFIALMSRRNRLPYYSDFVTEAAVLADAFKQITDKCKHAINPSPEENKNENPIEDNSVLLQYFTDVEALFADHSGLFAKYNDFSINEHFSRTIIWCQDRRKFLDKAIDISIYRVELSKEKYKEILAASTSFHYVGRWRALTDTFAGASSLPFALGDYLYTSCKSIFFAQNPLNMVKITHTINQSIDSLHQGTSRFGYGCQMPVPPECIKGTVNNKKEIILANPYFQSSNPDLQVIYVLDARAPGKAFQEGITYDHPSNNPSGNLIFFLDTNIDYAFQCARQREEGLQFDKNMGWLLNSEWTDQQRAERGQKIKTILNTSGNPPILPALTNIVGEYLDIPASTAPSLRK